MFTAFLGTGAAATFFAGQHPVVASILSAVAALIQVIDLYYQPAENAKLHRELRRRFIDIDVCLVHAGDDPEKLRQCEADCTKIEADEPPVHRLTNAIANDEQLYVNRVPLSSGTYSKTWRITKCWARFAGLC